MVLPSAYLIGGAEQRFDSSLVLARTARRHHATSLSASKTVVLEIACFVVEIAFAIRHVQRRQRGLDELLQRRCDIREIFHHLQDVERCTCTLQ
jgi:hypothetical protein